MRITSVTVANYKSLRQVFWRPGPLTVVIGANASGKSNLADFHDFLADLYRHGLAVAVARKGGYENIAHRKMRRSRGAISVEVSAEVSSSDLGAWSPAYRRSFPNLRFAHAFSFRAEGRAIRSGFRIEEELVRLERQTPSGWCLFAEIERTEKGIRHRLIREESEDPESEDRLHRMFRFLESIRDFAGSESISSTELIISFIGRFIPILRTISDNLGAIRVFQFSPTNAREFGVPIPNPEMDRHGGNLPAVVDMIIKHHPKIWAKIIDVMQQLLPGLVEIQVDYTHSRTLGLYFHEDGVGRPWTVAEVSDGTIHSLALLVALYDPRATMLTLEEPENSVHTWILRILMEAAAEAAQYTQIVFTTHSRIVIDATKPNNVWVMWRSHGESNLAPLGTLDADLLGLIDEGDLSTFEILDTGMISQALPPAPKPSEG
jgi:predicted ATPase